MKKLGRIVLKVTVTGGRFEAHNLDRSVMVTGEVTPELLRALDGRAEAFWLATVDGPNFTLDEIAPRQDYRWDNSPKVVSIDQSSKFREEPDIDAAMAEINAAIARSAETRRQSIDALRDVRARIAETMSMFPDED